MTTIVLPPVVVDGPALTLWRAPTDNDRYAKPGPRTPPPALGGDTVVTPVAGGVRVEHRVVVPEEWDDVPRVGVRLALAPMPGVDEVEWFGRGPHESYNDRCASVRFGRWRTRIDDWRPPYVHPQGSGNRHGVWWLRIGGVRIDAEDRPLDVTVSHLTDEDMHEAKHTSDLQPRPETYVWLDAAHRGVGTGAVGPDTLPRYRVRTGEHRWSYTIRVSEGAP